MPTEYRAACHTCHATMRGPSPADIRQCPACGALNGAPSTLIAYGYGDGRFGYSQWADEPEVAGDGDGEALSSIEAAADCIRAATG